MCEAFEKLKGEAVGTGAGCVSIGNAIRLKGLLSDEVMAEVTKLPLTVVQSL